MSFCGCGKPNCLSCFPVGAGCCGNVTPTTPMAACGAIKNVCVEDHCQVIINQQFFTALKINNSWNVPDCQGAAFLYVSGVQSVLIGSYLWDPAFGYFEIIGFDVATQQITVQNNCNDGNAAVGTQVPACTLFVVVDAPTAVTNSGSATMFPYVAVDFTAPDNGDCILITVTNVNGLVVGKNVQIGSGIYRIDSIADATHITICNDGSGITPGTAVFAKNSAGQFQYPITLIDANPCTNDPVDTGCLMVCKDGVMYPLGNTGIVAGMVPTTTADDDCTVQFKQLDIPVKVCTTITCCFTLLEGDAGPYTINVTDSSEFAVGDLLQIDSRDDRFKITAILDSTHIQATVNPVPGTNEDIAEGTLICLVGCCEQLQQDFFLVHERDEISNAGNITLQFGGDVSGDSGTSILTITNNSATKGLFLHVVQNVYAVGGVTNGNNVIAFLSLNACMDLVTNPPPSVQAQNNNVNVGTDSTVPLSFTLGYSRIVGPVLPLGGTVNILHRALVTYAGSDVNFNYALPAGSLISAITVYGVTL